MAAFGENPDQTARKSSLSSRKILPDPPYAEIDPPWDSDLLKRITPATYHPKNSHHSSRFSLQNSAPRSLRWSSLSTKTKLACIHLPTRPTSTNSSATTAQAALCPLKSTLRYSTLADVSMPRRDTFPCVMLPMIFGVGPPAPRNKGRSSDDIRFGTGKVDFRALTRQNLADITQVHFYCAFDWRYSGPKMQFFNQWEFWRGPNALPRLRWATFTIPWAGTWG